MTLGKRKTAKRWPARPRLTPRGIAGTKLVVYIDAIVTRHVPVPRIDDCIRAHQRGGVREVISKPGSREPICRTKCFHEGFEWWAVSFPSQRRLFLGPPQFFAKILP